MNGLVFGFLQRIWFCLCEFFYLRSSQLSKPKATTPRQPNDNVTFQAARFFFFYLFFYILFFIFYFFIKKNVYFGRCGVLFVIIYIRFPSLSRLFCFPKSLTQHFFFFSKRNFHGYKNEKKKSM